MTVNSATQLSTQTLIHNAILFITPLVIVASNGFFTDFHETCTIYIWKETKCKKGLVPGAAVVVSIEGEIELISHTFHPVDFSPGFASNINLQFSVEQSHDALQTGEPSGALPANSGFKFVTRQQLQKGNDF